METLCPVKENRHKWSHTVWLHLYKISRLGKITENNVDWRLYQGLGLGGAGSYCVTVIKFLFGVMKNFWE